MSVHSKVMRSLGAARSTLLQVRSECRQGPQRDALADLVDALDALLVSADARLGRGDSGLPHVRDGVDLDAMQPGDARVFACDVPAGPTLDWLRRHFRRSTYMHGHRFDVVARNGGGGVVVTRLPDATDDQMREVRAGPVPVDPGPLPAVER